MRKLEIKDAELMRIAVQQEIVRSEESRYDHRLHGILLVCCGLSCTEVAEIFGHGRRTIQYWVRRFEESGFAGLEEIPRPGRPSLIDENVRRRLAVDLRCSPREFGYSQNLWDSKLLSHHLSKHYGVQLGERQCRRLFRQLGFSRRKPRPVIAKADEEAQREYKKLKRFAGRADIDIWFEDECHFQQHGSPCTMWVPPEDIDPVVFHAPTRKNAPFFGAIRASDGLLVTQAKRNIQCSNVPDIPFQIDSPKTAGAKNDCCS